MSSVAVSDLVKPLLGTPAVSESPSIALRTLIVGTGPRAVQMTKALGAQRDRRIIGAVDIECLPFLASEAPGVPWLGLLADMGSIALAHGADEICVALPLRSCFDHWLHAHAVGRELGIPVSFHFDLADETARAQSSPVMNATLLRYNQHPSSLGLAPLGKRLFDIAGALSAIVLLSPVLLLAALLVKLTSPGPVLFRQPRVGRGRRVFGMLKMRTMVQDAEHRRAELQALNNASGIMFKIARDPRLTTVGPFLRRTSIDELPQLFNVLKGEMSLVGPRPIPTWVYEQIDEPSFHRRFSVLPGMTGLWQVHGRPQEYPLMRSYDLRYVREWSFLMDLRILVRTIPAVLRRQGAQ